LEQATAHAGIGKQQSIHVADSSLKTSTNNADATFLGLVISNLASLDSVIAGLVNAFNILEAAAWKTYADAAAGAVKDWSHSMADYTETFANARIAAAVAFSHTEAAEAKTAGDLIAAANTLWTNTMADADKVYSDAMAVAAHTETDLLAAANKAKDIADSTARLTYTTTVAPLAVTLAEALSGFGVTRVTAIATAGETLSKATADANATFAGAMASPGIAYATVMAEAGKTYAITMAGIGKDESVASATLEKARLASLDASDPTFDYYGGGSGYSGGGSSYYGGSEGWYDYGINFGNAWWSAFGDYVNPWNDSTNVSVDWIDYGLSNGTKLANVVAVTAATAAILVEGAVLLAPATMQFSLVGSGHVIFGVSVRGGLPHLRHLGGLARLGQPVTTKGLLKYAEQRTYWNTISQVPIFNPLGATSTISTYNCAFTAAKALLNGLF